MVFKVVAGEGTGQSTPLGVELDGSGNIYVAGNFWGTVDFDGGAGTQALVSSGTSDGSPAANIFLARYDADGNLGRVATTGASTAYEVVNGFDVNADGEAWIAQPFGEPLVPNAVKATDKTTDDDRYILRGGSWASPANVTRTTFRLRGSAASPFYGARCVYPVDR